MSNDAFWKGAFGDEYTARNADAMGDADPRFFARMLAQAAPLGSIVELGANVGNNLRALRGLYPSAKLAAVEINETAAARIPRDCEVFRTSLTEWKPPKTWDLAFTKGVLIHIHPDKLAGAYEALFAAARRYLLVAEYFNTTPIEIAYRGHEGKLFKRDFAGDLLERFPLRLVDYGFAWRRDPLLPQDDLTWFLLEKAA
jgi:pseudaminic acid biosynthesis-associated methylase